VLRVPIRAQDPQSEGGLSRIWDFVGRSETHQDADLLFADFSELIQSFGFSYFVMAGLPAFGQDGAYFVIHNGWPEAWTARYRANRYFVDDPVAQWSFRARRPFSWSEADQQIGVSARSSQVLVEAAEFGLNYGLAFPIFDPENWQSVASLASDRPIHLDRRLATLVYLAASACRMSAESLVRLAPSLPELSARERELLTWAAAGKSTWEIAGILGISPATVNSHLANIRRKFGTTNTTQAVALAMRGRQIHL
jgi:LuxR family quorum sensing-dependent transcriptional regulator